MVKYYGKKKLINYIYLNKTSFIYLGFILLLVFIFTRFIINITVITEDKNLKRTLLNELDKNGISNYSLIKSNEKINLIKEKIVESNKDIIEWLNIERKGMKYIINVEPKVVKNKEEELPYCNIVSTKDSVVTRIISSKGEEIVDVNDSVKKGDVLVSGDITFNNETKKQVCASATVYGRTWYTVNLSLPRSYEDVEKLNKYRYNLLVKFNNKSFKIFKSRLKSYKDESKRIVNFLGIELYLQREVEVKVSAKEYNQEELNSNINKLVEEKMKHTLKGDYRIIDQKVLKKDINDSKIDIELFIVAEEEIGTREIGKIEDVKQEDG